jgi:hypothetical protein
MGRIRQVRRMRSTQFDDHFQFGEKPEEHRGRNKPETLCETIKRLAYSQNNQVRLSGELVDFVSGPAVFGDNFVFVDPLGPKSDHVRRLCIPPTIVQKAKIKRRAA